MEQRDPESGAAADDVEAPVGRPADIELATAAALAEAEQAAGDDGDDSGQTGRGAVLGSAGGGSIGPRRWAVVAAVAVSAVALTTTAAAVVIHGSAKNGTIGAALSGDRSTSLVTDTATGTPSWDAGTDPSSQSTTTSSASTTASSPSRTRPSTSPSKSATKPALPSGSDELDCQNTSHESAQDLAMKFSGMTKGTQHAFLDAQAAAKLAGISAFVLNSGYRSAAYQQRIYDCWVAQLGSPQAARQYALPPNQSAHVAGYAMDIAPQSAATWLESTKGEFGLCRRYADEPWHFEYQWAYRTKGCPALLPQP